MEEEIDEGSQLLTGVKKTDETNKELPPKDVPFMDRVRSLLQSSISNKNSDSSKLVDMLTRKPSSMIKLENEGPSKNSKMLNEPVAKVEQNREHSVKPMLSNEPEAKVEHENSEPSKDTKMLTSEPETTTEQENNEPSEDTKVLTSEPETTTESEDDEPSEDTEMFYSEPETSMELESPEPSEDEDDDSEKQASGNSISDKIKDFFGWKKKYIQIKKVTTYYGIREPPTMDKLGLDCEEYFIENFQYYEDLPYLEVRREENDANINDNGEIEIENTVDGYTEDCTDFSGSNNEENTDSGERKGDNADRSKEKDEAKKDDSNKDEKILENINGNSYKECSNSNMEKGDTSNSDTEVKGKSIIQIAKKVATTILKAITDTYI